MIEFNLLFYYCRLSVALLRNGLYRASYHSGPGNESTFFDENMLEKLKGIILHENSGALCINPVEKIVKNSYQAVSGIFK